jgi:type I restriction enzyme S subunit
VDELMAAQARKVDSLKTHKKGLMQQLFPREGETQPRLRFPEFQNAGEWVQKPLGSMCRIRTGKKDANEGAADGIYPFFTCAEKHIYSHNYSFDAEAILIAGNANVGQTCYYKGKFEAYQRTYVLTDFKNMFVPYLYSFLNANLRPDLLAQVQTSAMSYIRLPMLEEYQINAPSAQAEQQAIASCLGSLDELIAAQARKLEALKVHKKGLMQGLFPSVEEAGL